MYRRKLTTHTAQDWISLKKVLEELAIPYTSHQYDDPGSPVLDEQRALSFTEEFSAQFFQNVKQTFQTEIYQTELASPSSNKPGKALLIMYSVLVTVLFGRYFYINYRASHDGNFNFSWNFNNNEQTSQHKTFKGHKYLFIDKNYDMNYERIHTFVQGHKVSALFDIDENGISEKMENYSLKGELSEKSLDQNQDGLMERWTLYLESGEVFTFIDKNHNGSFDSWEKK